jgi:predicted nuclease with TOPRIM domain
MKKLFVVVLIVSVLVSCTSGRKEYVEAAKPIVNNLEQIGAELEKSVEAIKKDGISITEFEAKIRSLEKRLTTEKESFNRLKTPLEMDLIHKNIMEAIAAEELAISAIKSYATRKNMYQLAERQLSELNREEAELLSQKEKAPKDEKTKNRLSKISVEKANLTKQKEGLLSEMDSQIKFYNNSHEYFTKMLSSMKRGLK